MNEKQTEILKELLDRIPADDHALFTELAECAIALGYLPKRNQTRDVSIDFTHRKVKRTILKLEEKEQKHAGLRYGERGVPGIRMKFFASGSYSSIFAEGIRNVIEEFDGRYTGCYGCEACGAEPQGYTYRYPDGRTVFRCGRELISIFDFSAGTLGEMKALLRQQAAYFAARAD